MRCGALLAMPLLLAACTNTQVARVGQPVAQSQDGLAVWVVLTDPGGADHLLFCTGKGIHDPSSAQESACFEMTPRQGAPVSPMGVPHGARR